MHYNFFQEFFLKCSVNSFWVLQHFQVVLCSCQRKNIWIAVTSLSIVGIWRWVEAPPTWPWHTSTARSTFTWQRRRCHSGLRNQPPSKKMAGCEQPSGHDPIPTNICRCRCQRGRSYANHIHCCTIQCQTSKFTKIVISDDSGHTQTVWPDCRYQQTTWRSRAWWKRFWWVHKTRRHFEGKNKASVAVRYSVLSVLLF